MFRETLCGCLLALLLTGCGSSSEKKVPVELKDVPENLIKVATSLKELPDFKVTHAYRKSDGTYEICGKLKSGKVKEVEISLEGKVLDIE
jgi:hypothetical protein